MLMTQNQRMLHPMYTNQKITKQTTRIRGVPIMSVEKKTKIKQLSSQKNGVTC